MAWQDWLELFVTFLNENKAYKRFIKEFDSYYTGKRKVSFKLYIQLLVEKERMKDFIVLGFDHPKDEDLPFWIDLNKKWEILVDSK